MPIPPQPNMKNRLLLLTAVCALAFGPAVYAQEKKDEPETELGKKMETISGNWRAVKRQITDSSKNADTLKRLGVIKDNMTEAAKLEPALKAEKPAGEQAKFVADYRAKMKEEIEKIDKMIAAVK